MTTPTADPAIPTIGLDDTAAEAVLYGQALDVVIAERDAARRDCRVLDERLRQAWERVSHLNRLVTEADARAERYRHQADLSNAERARLAEEVAELRAVVTEQVIEPDAEQRRPWWRRWLGL